MKIREMILSMRPSKEIKGYDAISVKISIDGDTIEFNELIRNDDFESRFDTYINILKKEVLRLVNEKRNEYE